jgi:hypothetical protein
MALPFGIWAIRASSGPRRAILPVTALLQGYGGDGRSMHETVVVIDVATGFASSIWSRPDPLGLVCLCGGLQVRWARPDSTGTSVSRWNVLLITS